MFVKRRISPISLRKVIQTARFAEMTRAFTRDELAEYLESSAERAGRIASETARIGLVGNEGNRYNTTPLCSQFLESWRTSDQADLHNMMMGHPGYASFITLLWSASPISLEECMELQHFVPFPLNRPELNMVCSWAEEIGSVQQNFFTGQYYPVGELRAQFIPAFLKVYHQLEIPARPADSKKPVPILFLREFVCRRLRISRDDFDTRIADICEQRPEEFRPIRRTSNSHRKIGHREGNRYVSANYFSELFSRRRSYDGIEIHGRMYRFILLHEQ